MSIYAISDLHLALSKPDKTMEMFGEDWGNYHERIENNWRSTVKNTDTVIIPRRYIVGFKLRGSCRGFYIFKQFAR